MNLYPYNSYKINFTVSLWPFVKRTWWLPSFYRNQGLTETAKAGGAQLWSIRWLWLEISFNRWV